MGGAVAPTATLSHTTYERLRELILSGGIPTGTPLQEQRLAERLGVSRTPVREAIARLVSDGLVVRESGFTPVVRRLELGDLIEILHVRRLLEVEAAGRAAEAREASRLASLRPRFEAFLDGPAPDPETHTGADDALHAAIARLAGSRLLESLVADLRAKTRIFDTGRVPERLKPGAREHIAIIDAVAAGDAEAARTAMRAHIENVRASVLAHLERLA